MQCPRCGRTTQNAKFCTACGTALHTAPERTSPKNQTVALLLCVVLGIFGVHRFYVGKTASGLAYLFSFGLWFMGWAWDMYALATGTFKDAQGLPLRSGVPVLKHTTTPAYGRTVPPPTTTTPSNTGHYNSTATPQPHGDTPKAHVPANPTDEGLLLHATNVFHWSGSAFGSSGQDELTLTTAKFIWVHRGTLSFFTGAETHVYPLDQIKVWQGEAQVFCTKAPNTNTACLEVFLADGNIQRFSISGSKKKCNEWALTWVTAMQNAVLASRATAPAQAPAATPHAQEPPPPGPQGANASAPTAATPTPASDLPAVQIDPKTAMGQCMQSILHYLKQNESTAFFRQTLSAMLPELETMTTRLRAAQDIVTQHFGAEGLTPQKFLTPIRELEAHIQKDIDALMLKMNLFEEEECKRKIQACLAADQYEQMQEYIAIESNYKKAAEGTLAFLRDALLKLDKLMYDITTLNDSSQTPEALESLDALIQDIPHYR